MDIEELARTQRNISLFLDNSLEAIIVKSLSAEEFKDTVKNLPRPSKALLKALKNELKKDSILMDINAYAFFDFDVLRAIRSREGLDFIKQNGAEDPISRYYQVSELFDCLNLSFIPEERDKLLIRYFGPLYDKLDQKHKDIMKDIEEMNYQEVILYTKEFRERFEDVGAGLSWALLRSTSIVKNALANVPLLGDIKVVHHANKELATELYNALEIVSNLLDQKNEEYNELDRQRRNADRNLSRQLEKKKAIEQDYNKEKEKAAELTKKSKELEDRIKELENIFQKTINGDEEELELSTIKENLETWRELANDYENEVITEKTKREQTERKLKDIGSLVQDKNREIAKLQKKLSEYDKPISNGTGIEVYATPEFVERYNSDLLDYTDKDLKDSSLSDIIDEMIKHVCTKINQEGKSIKQDKSFYKVYGLLLYKRNHVPGRFSRLLVKTDYKKKIIIVDVTTKDDHEQNIKKQSGHYHDAVHGEVEYTKNEAEYIKIKSSIKDILSTD